MVFVRLTWNQRQAAERLDDEGHVGAEEGQHHAQVVLLQPPDIQKGPLYYIFIHFPNNLQRGESAISCIIHKEREHAEIQFSQGEATSHGEVTFG